MVKCEYFQRFKPQEEQVTNSKRFPKRSPHRIVFFLTSFHVIGISLKALAGAICRKVQLSNKYHQ